MDAEYTLTQQAFLLCYDLDKQRMARTEVVDHLVRAAALVELYQANLLVDNDGVAAPAKGAKVADPVLAAVLDEVGQAPTKSWRHWVRRNAKATKRAVRAELADRRVVSVEKGRVLGLFPHTSVTVHDTRAVKQAQARMRDAVRKPSTRLDPGGAALAALAAAGELGFLLDRGARKEHKDRIERCTQAAGPAAPGLRKVLQARRAATMSAGASGGAGG